MKRPRYSVLIPDAESGHALIVARCLAAAGARICALGPDQQTALRFSTRVDYYRRQKTRNRRDAFSVQFIRDQMRKCGANVFLPVDEPAHEFAIDHQDELRSFANLPPLATAEAYRTATNKDQLAAFLISAGLPTPFTVAIGPVTPQTFPPPGLDFPLLAKPVRGDGGRGIVALHSAEQAASFLSDGHMARFGRYVLQRYISGFDIDISALCVDGEIIAHTIQRAVVSRARSFAAAAGLEFLDAPDLLQTARAMFKKLRFSGIAHVDARYDEASREFKIIEVNARYWGSLAASLKAGVNFPDIACRRALGECAPTTDYAHMRFIDSVSYIKRLLSNPRGNSTTSFGIRETDAVHIMCDPVAEGANILMRWNKPFESTRPRR